MNGDRPGDASGDRELLERLAALPRELPPTRDRWPSIESAITAAVARPRRRHWLPAALAASLVLMLGSGLGGAWLGYGIATRAQPAAPAGEAGIEGIERSFASARESYLRAIALGDGPLDAPTRKTLQQNLAIIDRAMHELRAAMASDPGNPMYIDTLLMTREREMEMLADISRTTTTRL